MPEGIPQNLPRNGAKKFVGRSGKMKKVRKFLQKNKKNVAITGMGGIGKTELALQYAHSYLDEYRGGICWLEARSGNMGIQIINFARSQLNFNPPKDYDLQTRVNLCWRNWLQGNVLVIFDDVVDYRDIKPFLPPPSRFQVLITTRNQGSVRSFRLVELNVLEKTKAEELLKSFVGETRIQEEIEEAEALCEDLGRLPLGLELMARYLELKPDLSLAEARQRLLESKRLEHESLKRLSSDMTAERGVAAAFELSWQELNEEQQELGCLLSLFAPVAIPWSWVLRCLPKVKKENLENTRDYGLVSLSLLKRVDKAVEASYKLHPLIQEFFRSKLAESDSVEKVKRNFLGMIQEFSQDKSSQSNSVEEVKREICQVIVAEAKEIPYQPLREQILAFEPSIPHLEEIAKNLKYCLTDEDSIKLFGGLGRFYEGKGFYWSAQPWYEECLKITISLFGREHLDTGSSCKKLAQLYLSLGQYRKAEPLYLEAFEIRKQLLESDHLDIAFSLNNLAYLYFCQEQYKKAEPLYLEAFKMTKRRLESAHSSVLSGLGVLYCYQERYAESEPLLTEALQIHKQRKSVHPDIADSLNNLANLYYSQERYEEAEPLYLEALEMRKQLLGPAHPDIASSLNNLANLYYSQERYEEAEPLYLEASEMRKQLLKSEHLDIASSLDNEKLSNEKSLPIRSQTEGSKGGRLMSFINRIATKVYRLYRRWIVR